MRKRREGLTLVAYKLWLKIIGYVPKFHNIIMCEKNMRENIPQGKGVKPRHNREKI